MLKIELRRAFHGRLFFVSLTVGLVICLAQFFAVPLQAVQYLNLQASHGMLPNSVFSRWIGGFTDYFQVAYFAMLPVLAVLPYGDTFYADRRSGYARQYYMRMRRGRFLTAKYAASFLSAGVAVTAPLILNFLLTMTVLPSIIPVRPTLFFPISLPKSFLTELFYSNPYGYVLVYFLLDFLIAGLLAGLALLVSFASANRFIPLLFPFALYFFAGTLLPSLNQGGWALMSFANPAQMSYGTHGTCVAVTLLVLALASASFFVIGGKEDVY